MRNGSNRRALLIFCLLGIVPEDEAVSVAAGAGKPVQSDKARSAAAAYQNIARRLHGEEVSLMRL